MIALATILAGLGIFFFGLDVLTASLKRIIGRRLRTVIAAWNVNRWWGLLWGVLAGVFTPSGTAIAFVLVSMMRTGALTAVSSLPLVVGSNIGQAAIVMFIAIDVDQLVLALLGTTGILRLIDRLARWRALLDAGFGLALLYYGLSLVRLGAAPLAAEPWVAEILVQAAHWYAAGFAAGACLALITQSSSAVAMLAVALAGAGVFSFPQAVMAIYGANVGSSFNTVLLTLHLRGRERQLANAQVAYNVVGALVLVPLLYVEVGTGFPLMLAFLTRVGDTVESQAAIAFLMFNIVPGIVLMPLLGPFARILERLSPPTAVELESKPRYLHEHALGHVDTALDLVALEQTRLLGFLPRHLDLARADASGPTQADRDLDLAFATLAQAIDEFLDDLGQADMSTETYERLHVAVSASTLIRLLGETTAGLVATVREIAPASPIRPLADLLIEALDTVLISVDEALAEGDQLDLDLVRTMTADRPEVLQSVREAHMSTLAGGDLGEGRLILTLTGAYERALWLLRRYLEIRDRDLPAAAMASAAEAA